MTTDDTRVPEQADQSTAPHQRPFGRAAYFVHFDPVGVVLTKTVTNADDSVARPRFESDRDDAVETVLVGYRDRLIFLLRAARQCGFDVNRLCVRLNSAKGRFRRTVFEEHLTQALDRLIRPEVWLLLVNAPDNRTPQWLVDEGAVALAIDHQDASGGKRLHCEDSLRRPDDLIDSIKCNNIESICCLLISCVDVKWEFVKQSRLPVPSPKSFLELVNRIEAGDSLDVRLAAAKSLAALSLPCDEVPVLLALLEGKEEPVQVLLIATVGRAIQDDGQADIGRAREQTGLGLLRALGGGLVGRAAHEAVKVVAFVSKQPGQLRDTLLALVEELGSAGMVTHAIPAGNDLTSLVLAAPRSRKAKEQLHEKVQGAERVDVTEQHELLNCLDRLRRQVGDADAGEKNRLVEALKGVLDQLEGLSFGSLEANRRVARLLNDTLEAFGQRICCTHPNCGRPARVSVLTYKTDGLFTLDHGRQAPRYHLTSVRLPALPLVESVHRHS